MPEARERPDRRMVIASELHVGDYLTFACEVVVGVDGETVRCRRGPTGPDIVHRWPGSTPVWVRWPRLKV